MPVVLGIRPSAAREASSSSVRNALPPPRRTSSSVSAGSGADAQDGGDLGLDVRGPQALQLDPLDRWDAHDLGDPREQRVAPVQLVAAVGDHDRARPAAGPDEVADQVERGGVGPVQVLEHDHQRAFASRALEQRAHGIEDPARDHGVRHVDGTRVGEPRGQAGHEADEVGADAVEQRRDVSSSVSRSRPSITATTGAYGSGMSTTAGQPPTTTRTPSSARDAASSATRRLLPTPASPLITTAVVSPAAPRSTAVRSCSSSALRPTITGLEILRAMTPIIRIVLGCAACSGGRPGQCSATCTRGDRQRAKPKVRRVVVSGSAIGNRVRRRRMREGLPRRFRVELLDPLLRELEAEAAVEVLHRCAAFRLVRPVRCWRPGRYRR